MPCAARRCGSESRCLSLSLGLGLARARARAHALTLALALAASFSCSFSRARAPSRSRSLSRDQRSPRGSPARRTEQRGAHRVLADQPHAEPDRLQLLLVRVRLRSENRLEDALLPQKAWSANCLNRPIVARAHAPRHASSPSRCSSASSRQRSTTPCSVAQPCAASSASSAARCPGRNPPVLSW
jgi:hypothetical protein